MASNVVNITALQASGDRRADDRNSYCKQESCPPRNANHCARIIKGAALPHERTLNMMKGLILSALLICVVISLVRHPQGAVFNNRGDHHGEH